MSIISLGTAHLFFNMNRMAYMFLKIHFDQPLISFK